MPFPIDFKIVTETLEVPTNAEWNYSRKELEETYSSYLRL